ncbi:hypothetical protein VB712_06550 [Spirulina sp. CCNP1310]|uniref:hypothetical protein n=1 Tax=Spirulina sp. CCNP1310 TaxID=3110249 RepID=UPI002B1FC498|nr:hypothetical protein [Spirulina sp. CCNP1310]MEA5418881.1 hypothetical protein [Spirulina sp. CCNP1310]
MHTLFYLSTCGMSDLRAYISKRRANDPVFDEGFNERYKAFKIGALLKQAREQSGPTQRKMLERLHPQKSAIFCIENPAEDIRLSPLN